MSLADDMARAAFQGGCEVSGAECAEIAEALRIARVVKLAAQPSEGFGEYNDTADSIASATGEYNENVLCVDVIQTCATIIAIAAAEEKP